MITAGQTAGLDRVQDILHSQPEYLSCLPFDYERRVIYPALVTNQLRFLCNYRAFVTWFWPDYPPDGIPDGREFVQRGPLCWIVDVVAMPGVNAMRLGREVAETMYTHARVWDRERVGFCRWPSGRYGHITSRAPRGAE
jgi:hypothetical protein